MIIVKNRELLIPNNERYIGTTYDNDTENRVFQVPRFSQRGVDLANLTFRLDIQYANEAFDTVVLGKEVGEAFIILIWRITSAALQVPGTMYIGLRAIDDEATVKWSSFSAAMYAERHLNTPGNYGGSLTEIEQIEQDHQYMKGVIDELRDNLDYAHDAEAWAIGKRDGEDVGSTDPTYHNNSKYYSQQSSSSATAAANSATAAAGSATQAAETVADTNTRFNNAVAAVTVNTEVQDARVGADGTTYTVLKNRLDAEHTDVKSALKNNSQGILNGVVTKGQLTTAGAIGTDTRYCTTEFIYVADTKVLSVTSTSYRECQFYDANYELISRTRPTTDTTDLSVPSNAVYFRTSTSGNALADLKVTKKITTEQHNHAEMAWGQTTIVDGNPSQTNTVIDASIIAFGYLRVTEIVPTTTHAYTTKKIYLNAGDKLMADEGYKIYLGKVDENDSYTTVGSGSTINIQESTYYKFSVSDSSGTKHDYPSDIMSHVKITNIARAEFDGKALPGYVKAEADTVLTKLRAHLMDSKVSMFGFNTDQHISNITRLPIINGLRSLAYVSKYIPLSFICLGGDACRSHSNTSLPGNRAEIIDDVVNVYGYAIEADCPVVSLAGNHDYYGDAPAYITQSDMYTAHAKRGIVSKIYTEYDDDCDYMIDEYYTNIRYIFANSNVGANADVTVNQRVTRLRAWVSHCLETMPEGYNAVLISHHCLVSGTSISDNSPEIGDLLAPYADRIICCINGHTHRDGSATKDGILYIATTCAGPANSADPVSRTYGTADETAEDVYVIDQGNQKIYAIRYGNGTDREFTYTLE